MFLESPFWSQGAFVMIDTAAIKCSSCLQIPWWNCVKSEVLDFQHRLAMEGQETNGFHTVRHRSLIHQCQLEDVRLQLNHITCPRLLLGFPFFSMSSWRASQTLQLNSNSCFTTPSYWLLTWQRPTGRLRQTRSHSQIRWPANVLTDWLGSNFHRDLDHDSSLVDIQ